ncbi:MAG: 3'(2'),5'-bisphosphate nucleotidase CysQ [Galbibacter orientalis]|uniref:3'(2'),5'-bisphosphate nucleotidase CysQ n=1 Tax=Galbibacter orientalis TaxID=453852 RepID=UPI003001C817
MMNDVIKAAIVAGEKIIEIYNEDIQVKYKKDDSPLTIADKASNDVIQSYLEKTDIPIISEENKQIDFSERKNWDKCWIVDPLDGTKEFIKKNGEFTVNIALVENRIPVYGVIYVPVTKELYVGDVTVNKAWKIKVDNSEEDFSNLYVVNNEIQPTFNNSKDLIRVVGSRSHMNVDTENFVEDLKAKYNKVQIVSKGSSLKFCLVAEGKADIYPRFAPTMEWDTAAGQAICNAVGFEVIDQSTQKPLVYNRENLLNNYFLVK